MEAWVKTHNVHITYNFGVKYVNKEDTEHLMSVLKQNYEVEEQLTAHYWRHYQP